VRQVHDAHATGPDRSSNAIAADGRLFRLAPEQLGSGGCPQLAEFELPDQYARRNPVICEFGIAEVLPFGIGAGRIDDHLAKYA
jgi:hypothetical protein